MTLTADVVDAASARLLRAIAAHVPCEPVRDLIGTDDIEIAYAVQARLIADRINSGARIVGRKIGLTSEAVQRQLGVDRPDFGYLLDDMDLTGEPSIPMDRLIQPKVEAEIAFILGQDLTASDLDVVSVRAAVDHMRPALEIVDSRIRAWDISFGDTVADNASSGLFVLGDAKVTLDRSQPSAAEMTMTLDGHEVSAGSGQACLGDPLHALAWLANTARDLGSPLLAGQIILSGALGPMAPVTVGSKVVATISGLGTVTAQFH